MLPSSWWMTYHYVVEPFSFLALLEHVEAAAPRRPWALSAKVAEIKTSPRTFFVYVKVPESVADRLRAIQRDVIPDASRHQEIDHVTLVYVPKPREGEHPPDKIDAAVDALRVVGADHEPIKARIQGWGYFDGAEKDGKGTTALVALLDAPGLEHLHVGMTNALKEQGLRPSGAHVFTPHITLGYLEQHGRSDRPLPPLSGSFTIDRTHVAARGHHEIPLTGGYGLAKAASEFSKGVREEQGEHHLPRVQTQKLVTDHLAKDPAYYTHVEQGEQCLADAAAKHAMLHRSFR